MSSQTQTRELYQEYLSRNVTDSIDDLLPACSAILATVPADLIAKLKEDMTEKRASVSIEIRGIDKTVKEVLRRNDKFMCRFLEHCLTLRHGPGWSVIAGYLGLEYQIFFEPKEYEQAKRIESIFARLSQGKAVLASCCTGQENVAGNE